MSFVPAQCSERESGGYEDCTWASGVMLNNAAHAKNVSPSTRTEYQALRVAGGDGPAENPGDGSNIGQLATGIKNRYHWSVARIGPPGAAHPTFDTLWSKLQPGYGAVVQGWMGVWIRTSHWRRWDPNFGGAHAVYVQRRDTSARVWWMNPLAPNSYAGEWMDKSDLKKYWDGMFGGAAWVRVGALAPLPDTSEDTMDSFPIPNAPSQANVRAGAVLYKESTLKTKVVTVNATTTVRYIGHVGDVAIIGWDQSPEIVGKSALFAKAADVGQPIETVTLGARK